MRKKESSLFCIYDPLGVKLLRYISQTSLSHLNEDKFRHGFSDTINPMCACETEIETTEHFLLQRINKKQFLVCKKLSGRTNHHQLLNEYVLRNFFAFIKH